MYPKLVIFILFTTASMAWSSQYDLQKFIQAVDEGNYRLQAAEFNLQAQREAESSIEVWKDPSLSLQHYMEPIQTRTGNQSFKWSLQQKLPWLDGSDARASQAKLQSQLVHLEKQQLQRDLEWKAKQIFAHHLWLAEDIKLQRTLYQLIQEKLTWVEQQLGTASVPLSEFIQLKIWLDKYEINIENQKIDHQKHNIQLGHLIGMAPQEHVLFSDPYIQDTLFINDLRSMTDYEMSEDHYDIQEIRIKKEILVESSEEVEFKKWPEMTLLFDYHQLTQTRQDPYSIGLRVNLPIYNSNESAQINSHRLKAKSLESKRKHLELENREAWKISHLEIKKLLEQLSKYSKEILPQSEKLISYQENALSNEWTYQQFENWFTSVQSHIELKREVNKIQFHLYQEFAKLQWIRGGQNAH